jgi:polyvinyl alcohol dehydrogenase (cytochrome)
MRWSSFGLILVSGVLAVGCKATEERKLQQQEETARLTASMAAKGEGEPVVERETMPGADVYRQYCAKCHEGQVAKAPSKTFLQLMAPDAVLAALATGVMQQQSKALKVEQKRQVAEYLSGESLAAHKAPPEAPRCTGDAARFDLSRAPRIHGWGFDAANTRRIPADVAGLAPADIPRLKLKWAFAYPGALRARSQPTFAMGSMFVGSQNGTVYALDASTGCVRWTFRATAEVRTPVVVTPWSGSDAPNQPLAFFGDLIGRVYAVDALTGALRWKLKADDHPSATITGAPAYYQGRLYVPVSSLEEASADPAYPCCTFRGSVVAIDAASGKVLWKSYTIAEKPRRVGKTDVGTPILAPSGAPIWSPLTIDARRGVLYATTGNNYSAPATAHSDSVLAFDLVTGAIRWGWQSFQSDAWNVGCMIGNDNCPDEPGPDFDMGSGAILLSTASGRDLLLAGRKDGTVLALDPDHPDGLLWQRKLGRGSIQGGVQWGMTAEASRLYVPIADMEDSHDGKVHAEPAHPGLYALDPLSGQLLWSSPSENRCKGETACDPGILAAVTSIPGAVFAGHMDGMIRAYDDASGRVLWQYDSRQEVATLSGVRSHGGSVGGPGPVIHDGVVYVNSGYGLYFHLPGNVLFAFSVDGR